MELQHLNDDCLDTIFKFLSLSEHFAVMRLQCSRFDRIIESIWRRKYSLVYVVCNTDPKSTALFACSSYHCVIHNQRDYTRFMSVISQGVVSLLLKEVEQLDCLAKKTLPRVQNLMVTLKRDFHKTIILSKMFPALERLVVTWADCSDDGVDYAYADYDMPRWKLRKTLFALPLSKTLNDLTLNEDLLQLVVKHVVTRLPALRRIAASYSTGMPRVLLPQIAQFWPRAHRVHTLSFNFVVSGFKEHLDAILKFRNIRRLHLIGGEHMIERYGEQLERILRELPHLREIHYRYDVSIDIDEEDEDYKRNLIYDFIRFTAYILKLQQDSNQRISPLKLYCYGPKLGEFFNRDVSEKQVQYS